LLNFFTQYIYACGQGHTIYAAHCGCFIFQPAKFEQKITYQDELYDGSLIGGTTRFNCTSHIY